MSGERIIAYAPPPALLITEPVCPMGVGTDYQEISVSAVLPIFAEADLPGGRGGTVPTSVDKTCADVGVVRLAFVFGKRSIPTGRYNFRVHPFILPRPVGSNA